MSVIEMPYTPSSVVWRKFRHILLTGDGFMMNTAYSQRLGRGWNGNKAVRAIRVLAVYLMNELDIETCRSVIRY